MDNRIELNISGHTVVKLNSDLDGLEIVAFKGEGGRAHFIVMVTGGNSNYAVKHTLGTFNTDSFDTTRYLESQKSSQEILQETLNAWKTYTKSKSPDLTSEDSTSMEDLAFPPEDDSASHPYDEIPPFQF